MTQAINIHCLDFSNLTNVGPVLSRLESIGNHLGKKDLLVIGAPARIADLLRQTEGALSRGDRVAASEALDKIQALHSELIQAALHSSNSKGELGQFVADVDSIRHLLKLPGTIATSEFLLAFGDIWMARLVAAKLDESGIAANSFGLQNIVREKSGKQLSTMSTTCSVSTLLPKTGIQVIPSVVMGAKKQPIVVKPNQLAGWLSRSVRSQEIVFWVDSKLRSAEPTIVTESDELDELSRTELEELARVRHACLPHWEHIHRETNIQFRHVSDQECTQIVKAASQKGVKAVHAVEDVYVLTLDATDSDDIQDFAARIQSILAASGIHALATDFDQDYFRLAFFPEVAQHAKAVLRAKGISKSTVEFGYTLIAIVGSSLDEDWLLSFEFQKVFCGTVKMLDRTNDREIAVFDKGNTSEFVNEIHDNLVGKPAGIPRY